MRIHQFHAGSIQCMPRVQRVLMQITVALLLCGLLVTATPGGVTATAPNSVPPSSTATTATVPSAPAKSAPATAKAPSTAPITAANAPKSAAGGNVTVNPNTGPTTGSQTVQITIPSFVGTLGLSVVPSVTFGGTAATACTAITVALLVPSYTFTCATPAHAAGPVDVEAKALLALGVALFDFTGTGAYTYVSGGPIPPTGTVTVNPNHGPQSGGQVVTITVSGLAGLVGLAGLSGVLPTVTFGSNAATGCDPITVSGGSVSFKCTTPAHLGAGPVDVTVVGGLILTSTGTGAYTYDPAGGPPVTSGAVTVNPNQGPTVGGQTVTITIPSSAGIVGLSLLPVAIFGGNAATGCSLIQATTPTGTVSFTCLTPAHVVGPVNVEVKDVLGLLFDFTGANAYTYVTSPIVGTGLLTVSPNHGPTAGGQTVTITVPSAVGLIGLTLAPSATFGGSTATSCSTVSASVGAPTISFTCVTPAHAIGLVDVHVTDALGLLNITGVGAYTYDNGPPATGGNVTVNPNQGPTAGGQLVTITVPSSASLVGLSLAPSVTFGGVPATACTAIAATIATGNVSFTCNTPPHPVGFVDVTVTTTLNLVNATGTNAYDYVNGGPGTTVSMTALTSSINPSTVGQPVTFTATVTGTGGTPTGTVTFKDGTTTLGTGTLAAGVATLTTTTLAQGDHPITAVYGGDATYAVSTSPTLTQTVNTGGPPPSVSGLVFFPLPKPIRLLDTRNPSLFPAFPACIQPNAHLNASSLTVQARSSCTGIPNSAVAITGNGTVDSRFPGSQSGFVTFYSSGNLPLASNLNYVPNVAVPNAFTVSLASDGTFQAYASATTDVIVDVSGYYALPSAGGLYFHPLRNPVRLLDTRVGYQACITPNTPMTPNVALTVQAASACTAVPNSALALAGNGTVDNRVQNAPPGYVTFYPSGQNVPTTSNLNYVPNQAVPNAFIIGLNNGSMNAYATTGTDVIIDVTGYFDADSTGLTYTALLNPVRLLDTRSGNYAACVITKAPIAGHTSYNVAAQPTCTGITSSAKAVLGNGTVVNGPSGPPGFVTFYPGGQTLPLASNLNYVEGQVVPNAFIIGVGSDGSFNAYVTTTIDLVIDVGGFFA